MDWSRIAAWFCIIVGSSLLIGFVTQFRERLYVGTLGLSFLALAIAAFLHPVSPPARNVAIYVACGLFLIAFYFALQETRARLAALRRQHKAMEDQLLAMIDAEMKKQQKTEPESESESK
jgi:hypothetical protein